MTICVFGAGGRTGVEVVRYARRRGCDVTASIYSENSRRHLPPDVRVKRGDVLRYDDVLTAVRGADAVISVVGHITGSDPFMQTKGVRNIVRAMNAKGIRRIVSLTGTGVRGAGDRPSIVDRMLNAAVKIVDPDRVKDGIEHVEALRNSDLDWTVVRVLKLGNSDRPIETYKLTSGGPAELLTSRKKAAHALVDLAHGNEYSGKMPVISG